MAHDMFGQVSARRPTARGRRSSLIVLSVTAHLVGVVAILAASMLMPIALPVPPAVMAYYEPRLVRLADIPLPTTQPRAASSANASSASASSSSTPVEAAPLEAPAGVGPETGREGTIAAPSVPSTNGLGDGGTPDFGAFEQIAVPAPAPPPASPVRLHSGIQAPERTVYVEPVYPPLARSARAQGPVILEAVIDVDGRVTSLRVLRSIALLDQTAMAAVRQWQFTPARLNGEPVPVIMTVTVIFTLN